MPQFDTVTFLSQLFWLTIIFTTFYMVVIKNFLPGLTRIMKIRRKKLEYGAKQGSGFMQETSDINANYDRLLGNKLAESKDSLSSVTQSSTNWVDNVVKSINTEGDLKQANQAYLNTSINIIGKRILTSK
jgi:F0F1-type ATP synthase membrane subunit b/b'